jgi:hypothetical protein
MPVNAVVLIYACHVCKTRWTTKVRCRLSILIRWNILSFFFEANYHLAAQDVLNLCVFISTNWPQFDLFNGADPVFLQGGKWNVLSFPYNLSILMSVPVTTGFPRIVIACLWYALLRFYVQLRALPSWSYLPHNAYDLYRNLILLT